MRKWICILLLVEILLWPTICGAADLRVNFSYAADGAACGEVVYDGQLLWRVMVLPDEVKPASLQPGARTTLIVPSLANGFYWLEVQNR